MTPYNWLTTHFKSWSSFLYYVILFIIGVLGQHIQVVVWRILNCNMVIVPKMASSFCIRSTRLLKLREFVPFLKTRLMLLPNDDWVAFCLMPRFAPNMESFWRNSSSLVAPMAVVEVAWVIWSGRASLSVKTRWTTRTVRRRIMVGEEEWYIFFWIVLELMPPMPSISFAWLLPITVAKKVAADH